MNELKFNSQVCTTKEQSQRLLDLGLKPETADMYIFDDEVYIGKPNVDDIPAWSLHRLYEIYLSSLIIRRNQNLYDSLISDIELMMDAGFFKKEYLK